jgi:putative membrane protein
MLVKKKVAFAAGMVFLFYAWTEVLAQGGRYGNWPMGPGTMYGWGMGWFGGIFSLIFWILLIVGMVFLIRWLIHMSKGHSESQSGSRAIEILKERYARGEIDKQEFEEKKKDLGH